MYAAVAADVVEMVDSVGRALGMAAALLSFIYLDSDLCEKLSGWLVFVLPIDCAAIGVLHFGRSVREFHRHAIAAARAG